MKKQCFKCKLVKQLRFFYPHKKMADGHLNKCKDCAKKDAHARYNSEEGIKKIIAYERKRAQYPHRKKRRVECRKVHRREHRVRNVAWDKTTRAIREGKLIKKPCEECGDLKSQAHHPDYSKPLEVVWFCRKHHLKKHGKKSWL